MAIRITQAGVALTVGIIIVTGLMIGGFFTVKNSGEQARRGEAIKIAEQNLNEQSNDGTTSNNDPNNTSGEATKPDETTKNESSSDNTNSSNSDNTSTSDQATNKLPQTGPADQLLSSIVLALLTFSITSYVSSRRQSVQ